MWSRVSIDGDSPPCKQNIYGVKDTIQYQHFTLHMVDTYPAVHQCRYRKVVKQICEVLPHVRTAVLAETLVIEPVHLSDLPCLMVASKDSDSARIANLYSTRVIQVMCDTVSIIQ